MNFILLGAAVNFAAVIIGSFLGLLFKKGIPEKVSKTVMNGMGLCVLFIGLSGLLADTDDGTKRAMVLIFSVIIGAVIGELIDLDALVNRLGSWLEGKLGKGYGSVAEGFVTATLLFCVGAMAVLGPLESGLKCEHTTQITKSVLDFVSSVIYASSMGIGVMFSAFSVFLLQGTITLMAGWLEPLLTPSAVAEMTVVGSLLIVGLALNILGITRLKIMNYLPAVFLAVPVAMVYDGVMGMI